MRRWSRRKSTGDIGKVRVKHERKPFIGTGMLDQNAGQADRGIWQWSLEMAWKPVTLSKSIRAKLWCLNYGKEGNGTPLRYSCLENSMGGGALVGCSPWGLEESDTTERLHFHFSLSCIGEGNGNPHQCSCLENPKDGGAWWAAIYGVAQSQTRLKRLSSSSNLAAARNVQFSTNSGESDASELYAKAKKKEMSLFEQRLLL